MDDYFPEIDDSAELVDTPDDAGEGSLAVEAGLAETLLNRRRRIGITLSEEDYEALFNRVQRDFENAIADSTKFREYHTEYMSTWRGIPERKSFPFEGAHNIQVPVSSTFVEQTKARLYKALLGGDLVCQFTRLDEAISDDELNSVNQWFKWELDHVVGLRKVMRQVLHDLCVDGIGLAIPAYRHKERRIFETREFTVVEGQDLESQMVSVMSSIFPELDELTPTGLGKYTVEYKDYGEEKQAKVTFLLEDDTLVAEIDKPLVVFDGVEIERIDCSEDLIIVNSGHDVDELTFFGRWGFLSLHDFLAGIEGGFFRDLDSSTLEQVIGHASDRFHSQSSQPKTTTLDKEEGTQTQAISSSDYSRRWVEYYYWEGWWSNEMGTDDQPTGKEVQLAVWADPRSRTILKVAPLAELSPDGCRTPVKFDFILQPGRFFSVGIVEWLRHIQATLNAIYNQRLDAGLLLNAPWGFYEPTAGTPPQILSIQPGKMYPVKNAKGFSFPQTNWSPTWSFNEEANAQRYAQQQAGLGDAQVGSFISKRASASEFMSTVGAADIRTEYIVDGLLESLRKLLYKVYDLYKKYAPDGRVFQVSSHPGEVLVKKFDRSLLDTKMSLQLSGNSQQISAQLERDVALNMLSLLNNPILIQMGIVKPDTIYAAVQKITQAMNYKNVPIYRPDYPKAAPPPDIEHKMLAMGKPLTASPMDNHNEHLSSHTTLASDPKIGAYLPNPQQRQTLAEHIQHHLNLQQAAQLMQQQQAAMAAQMQQAMATMGIQPGMTGGSQPGDQAQPAEPSEGLVNGPTFGPQ